MTAGSTRWVYALWKVRGFPRSAPTHWLGLVKIGSTNDVRRRCREHRALPVGMVEGGKDLEARVHEQLSESHLSHEWFVPSPEVVAWVASLPVRFDDPPYWPPNKENQTMTYQYTPAQLADIYGPTVVAHSQRFRQVSTGYPHAVALAYDLDVARAAADCDEQVAATVAAWERANGYPVRDWAALGAAEREDDQL